MRCLDHVRDGVRLDSSPSIGLSRKASPDMETEEVRMTSQDCL